MIQKFFFKAPLDVCFKEKLAFQLIIKLKPRLESDVKKSTSCYIFVNIKERCIHLQNVIFTSTEIKVTTNDYTYI